MRKITTQAVNAFLNSQSFRSGNTHVLSNGDYSSLFLHGNDIAERSPYGTIRVTTAGWNTNTTKERLRGIPGVRIETKKGQLYLNGKEWDGSWATI